jgi:hypothetical protein
MPPKLKPHRREQLVGEAGTASGTETFEQRGAQDMSRNSFVNRGGQGPASFTRIGDSTAEAPEIRIAVQRLRREVEEP